MGFTAKAVSLVTCLVCCDLCDISQVRSDSHSWKKWSCCHGLNSIQDCMGIFRQPDSPFFKFFKITTLCMVFTSKTDVKTDWWFVWPFCFRRLCHNCVVNHMHRNGRVRVLFNRWYFVWRAFCPFCAWLYQPGFIRASHDWKCAICSDYSASACAVCLFLAAEKKLSARHDYWQPPKSCRAKWRNTNVAYSFWFVTNGRVDRFVPTCAITETKPVLTSVFEVNTIHKVVILKNLKNGLSGCL